MVAMGRGAAVNAGRWVQDQAGDPPATSMLKRQMSLSAFKFTNPQGRVPRMQRRLSRFADRMRQHEARKLYKNPRVQWAVAGLIAGNFLTNCVEKQMDPWGDKFPETWAGVEFCWNVTFIAELMWNMYGSFFLLQWRGHFLSSGWNLFDLLVVGVSIPSVLAYIGVGESASGVFGMLRMLRAFRILRLFRRVESLNKIIVSLGKAVPGLANAGLVMLLVMCIYAILGVDLFGKHGSTGTITNTNGEVVPLMTLRGLTYGEEYYGNFFRSLYTLFQVLTGESWSEVIARPTIYGQLEWRGTFFYVSYILVCGIVLINVVVAVLLDKMMDGSMRSSHPATFRTLPRPFPTAGSFWHALRRPVSHLSPPSCCALRSHAR